MTSATWLILCGVFSGSAAACKYTALLLTPLGCLGILWFASRRKAETLQALRLLTLYVAAAFIAGIPFYLKNWIMTGNPFYPFFYGIFGGRGWDGDQARLYDLFIQSLGMGRRFLDYLLLPWNLSLRAKMDSPQFDGILGPIFLLTLPFLAGLRRWETPVRVVLVYALLTFLFWASSAQQIRYLIPLFATPRHCHRGDPDPLPKPEADLRPSALHRRRFPGLQRLSYCPRFHEVPPPARCRRLGIPRRISSHGCSRPTPMYRFVNQNSRRRAVYFSST